MSIPGIRICDIIFFLLAATFAWLAVAGGIEISGSGAQMDSDLETYAQAMAAASDRAAFSHDPALYRASPANSIPNLERWLGEFLAPQNEWAIGLLRAGGIAIFLFLEGWYLLGRWLYKSPALAALLALCCSITVWIGWGTFWGALHSDPVPRVFFASFFPFLLLLFFKSLPNWRIRPLAMFAAGAAVWIHGVSALNCGAMFFMAFLTLDPGLKNRRTHALNLIACLCAFLLPVLVFLWPSLRQGRSFTADELDIFIKLFDLRWHEDYSGFAQRLIRFFSPGSAALPIMAGGIAGWIILKYKGGGKEKLVAKAFLPFLAGLFAVTGFCWLETQLAPKIGRLPMGHELVRGLRFLVPISWLLIIGGVGSLTGQNARRAILCVTLALTLYFTSDRQYAAVQYSITRLTGLHLPLSAQAGEMAASARGMRQFFVHIGEIVPPGESIYCPADAMPVRYISKRALIHAFKDGYLHFYNKDAKASAHWLKLETLANANKNGWQDAWIESGADWLLLPPDWQIPETGANLDPAIEYQGWRLFHGQQAQALKRMHPGPES